MEIVFGADPANSSVCEFIGCENFDFNTSAVQRLKKYGVLHLQVCMQTFICGCRLLNRHCGGRKLEIFTIHRNSMSDCHFDSVNESQTGKNFYLFNLNKVLACFYRKNRNNTVRVDRSSKRPSIYINNNLLSNLLLSQTF